MTSHCKENFFVDIHEAYRELEKAGDERAKAVYEYCRLDEQKKSFLAKIELSIEGATQTEIERKAKADQSYFDYIDGLASAKEIFLRADAHYKNVLALFELKRTREVTLRKNIDT